MTGSARALVFEEVEVVRVLNPGPHDHGRLGVQDNWTV